MKDFFKGWLRKNKDVPIQDFSKMTWNKRLYINDLDDVKDFKSGEENEDKKAVEKFVKQLKK